MPRSFDFVRCVSSGQVFRWRETEENRWSGIDGCSEISVTILDDRFEVETSTSEQTFRVLFDLDRDYAVI